LLYKIANIVRGLAVDMIEKANSGHPGLPLGCAEIGAVLFGEVLKFNPLQPDWLDRDRFVLSAGHGSAWLYALLYLSGYHLSLEELKRFRQLNSKTPGHPEYQHTPGVEATTGPLGQGFANAVGMALAERMLAARYNTKDYKIIDHYTYTLLGDGCMMEGIVSEAASLAGHLGLEKLIAIYDDNQICLSGKTRATFTESVADRFRAYHWQVINSINGHNVEELKAAFIKARESIGRPTLIIARTHLGYGAPNKQDSSSSHGAPLGQEEVKGLKENISLPVEEEFYISPEVKEFFANRKKELIQQNQEWMNRFNQWARKYPYFKQELDQALELSLPPDLNLEGLEIKSPTATRVSSSLVLNSIADKLSYLVGGSADLDPSTKTYLNKYQEVQKDNFKGRNIIFGVREHAMGAIVNGIALHRGFRPYCSTFLVFSDYMRPAIRTAAMMKLPVIFIFTHDSIFVGEDGPTHQPVEQLEALRIIPNLRVLRPADEEEVKLAWKEILEDINRPVALILSRQNLPHLEKHREIKDFSRGGYIISHQEKETPQVILIASGSEVSIAVNISLILKVKGITSRVISVPDREKFFSQDKEYLNRLLGDEGILRVVIETSTGQGWSPLLFPPSLSVFVSSFGKSAPGQQVAEYFGFNPNKIAQDILQYLIKRTRG